MSNGTEGQAAAAAKREVQIVTMKDGRKVEFAGKRKMLKEVSVDGNTVSVRFDFRNGESILAPVPSQHLLYSAGHGYSQKCGDEVAGEEDVDDMFLGVSEIVERLQDGPWATKREGGGGFAGASILARALAEVTGKAIEEVKTFLKAQVDSGMTYPKLNAAFSEDEAVGPVIKRINAERVAKGPKVDTKSVLAQLR